MINSGHLIPRSSARFLADKTANPRDSDPPNVISAVARGGALNIDNVIDAVFRTDPFLYHKFENMLIFGSEILYSLCGP